jgi:hypothetical protein
MKSENNKPGTTWMYKMVVEINTKLNLNLPIVWYKFGQIPVVSYESEKENIVETDFSKLIPDKVVNDIVIDNIKLSSKEIKLKQYISGSSLLHQAYLLKENMKDNFYKNDFDFIKDNFNKFFNTIPYYKDENKTMDRFYEFVCKYNTLDVKLKIKNEYKDIFYKLFESFWNIIAIQNFENSMHEYYKLNNIKISNIMNCNYQSKIEENEFNCLLEQFYSKYITKKLNDSDDFLLKKLLEKT